MTLPDLKTPLLWVVATCLVLTLLGLGAGHVKLNKARAELADMKALAARVEAARSAAALQDAVQVAGAQSIHAAAQQDATHDLTKPDPALAAALADNRALAGRLRDTSAQLAAARDRPQGEADTAACRGQGDQLRTVLGLLEEAGRLSAESADLAAEGRGVIARRDAEVRALKAIIAADRALMESGSGRPIGPPELPAQ